MVSPQQIVNRCTTSDDSALFSSLDQCWSCHQLVTSQSLIVASSTHFSATKSMKTTAKSLFRRIGHSCVVAWMSRLKLWIDISACLPGDACLGYRFRVSRWSRVAAVNDRLLTSGASVVSTGGKLTEKTEISSFQTLKRMEFALTISLNWLYSHMLWHALIPTDMSVWYRTSSSLRFTMTLLEANWHVPTYT